MDDSRQKAFDFAQEATKQLIALSTGVLAVTITFLTDVIKTAPPGALPFIQAAWVFFLVSIFCGVFALLALAGNLERPKNGTPSIYRGNIVVCSLGQVVFFVGALGLTLVFGFKAF